MYIENWDEVPDGTRVQEDTYKEIYEICRREDGSRYLRVVDVDWGNTDDVDWS